MKLVAIAVIAALGFSSHAQAAATFEEIAAAVDASAFDEADDEWRRLMVARERSCGVYGADKNRRIDLIIDRYSALADAVSAGNESGAMEAGARLKSTVEASPRFGECWQALARRARLNSRLVNMF